MLKQKFFKFSYCFFILNFLLLQIVNAENVVYSVEEVESYLSNLTNYSASFDQVVLGEDYSKGKLYISKPGKFLWQYQKPEEYKIVSNGGLVYFIDEKNSQITQLPSTGFLFYLLGNNNIKFSSDKLKLESFQQSKRRINVNLIAFVDDMKIPVGLMFQKDYRTGSLSLIKIVSQNQLDQTVVISLYNQNENAKINKEIFKIETEEDELF